MRKATGLLMLFALVAVTATSGQTVEHNFSVPVGDFTDPYTVDINSGARSIAGPYDLDGDSQYEILVSDYTGGGRVHVLENAGADTWELVYSTPFLDSTATTDNNRAVVGADLDDDGHGEIIFFAGRGYSPTNPDFADLPPGLYAFEHTGTDNDYGTEPASIYDFGAELPDRWRTEKFDVVDVDGDGVDEIMFANNGSSNEFDNWYVYSVSGDLGSGFEVWVEELRLSTRASEAFDPVNRGGGSGYGIIPADLDGTGLYELSMHSWNTFNFSNAQATGADTYAAPDSNATNAFIQAGDADHVSLFSGTYVDINQDGDDEVFYPRFQSFGDGNVALINYEDGEDPLQITSDQVLNDFLSNFTNFGIDAGDMTSDGFADLIGAGLGGYSGAQYDAGEPSSWIKVAAWVGAPGADPEDTLNYDVRTFDTSSPADTAHFNRIVQDSLGTVTVYHETALSKFTAKVVYLGDADMDGYVEAAMSFQGTPDSIQVIDEVWNADSLRFERTVRETLESPSREFARIVSTDGFAVFIEDTEFILPDDYKLFDNYPNPFDGSTAIRFELPIDKRISVNVYDVTGRLVRSLVSDQLYREGVHEVTWDGTVANGAPAASGTYIYSLEYGNFRKSKSMTLVK